MVTIAEGKKLAATMNAQFVELSAKNNTAVNELFHNLILNIEKRYDDSNVTDRANNRCCIS